jgi:hypothetical protein
MKKRDLRHIGIYEDKRGQKFLYDPKKKEGFLIPENEVSKIAALQYRVWMVLSIGILLYFLFSMPWWTTVIISIALLIAAELIYRKMIASYSIITNYTPVNVLDKSIGAYKQNPKALLLRIGLYGVLGVLLLASIYGQPLNVAENQIILVVAAFALINAIYHLLNLIKTIKR